MKNLFYLASAAIVGLIIGGLIGYANHQKSNVIVGSIGDTNSTQRIASCVLDMSTTTPTTATTTATACLYNSDSKDRLITSVDYYLTGLAAANTSVASTTWKLATSTDIYSPGAGYLLNTTLATSSANGTVNNTLFVASSTPGQGATFNYRVWNAGTYLDLLQNASSTALGTIKVTYFIIN